MFTISNPFKRFRDSENLKRLTLRDNEHTPDNKRLGEVKSLLNITIDRSSNGEWVSVCFEEITTSDSGRIAGRTISATIPLDIAMKVAKFIETGE